MVVLLLVVVVVGRLRTFGRVVFRVIVVVVYVVVALVVAGSTLLAMMDTIGQPRKQSDRSSPLKGDKCSPLPAHWSADDDERRHDRRKF